MANWEWFSDRRWQGLALVATAPVAALGISLGCLVRNMVRSPTEYFFARPVLEPAVEMYGRMPGTGVGDAALTLFLATLTIVWIIALFRYVRAAPRSPLSIGAAIISLALFGYAARQTWLLGYPVCNPF